MKRIAVLTVGRSDYSIFRPILHRLRASPFLELKLIVSGAHLSTQHGLTIHEIERDDFSIDARVDMLLSSDRPVAISASMGLGLIGFAQAYAQLEPDLLLVLGDRFETMAGVLAALPMQLPVGHIHGGELTYGAIDDAMRHAITKMSHLHFVSTEAYAQRVMQLGEEPWRVHVAGAPSLDSVATFQPLSREELSGRIGRPLPDDFLLVTYHPTTVGPETLEFAALIDALRSSNRPVLITMPNADSGNQAIRKNIDIEVQQNPNWIAVESLGSEGYFSAMSYAGAMVGNSSSGIIEAASFSLPVVNIGTRQQGRIRAENVIDIECPFVTSKAILDAIQAALSPTFRLQIQGKINPYGDGHAAERIVDVLERTELNRSLCAKKFVDIEEVN